MELTSRWSYERCYTGVNLFKKNLYGILLIAILKHFGTLSYQNIEAVLYASCYPVLCLIGKLKLRYGVINEAIDQLRNGKE